MRFVAALVSLPWILLGCEITGGSTAAPTPSVSGKKVDLQVVEGQRGAVLAFAPVTIQGKGPFPFALDTGASTSAIDIELARELGLSLSGRGRPIFGVTGRTQAKGVEITNWSVGQVSLESATITGIDLPEPNEHSPQGLLGSDVLSRFGSVLVDYEASVLVLNPKI